jgi:hypothetical protein
MKKLEILMVAADPRAKVRIRFDGEIEYVRSEIEASRDRQRVTFDSRLATSPDKLLKAIDQGKSNIIHFICHSDSKGILLAGEKNEQVYVKTKALETALKAVGTRVKLVVLNSCESRKIAAALAKVCGCAVGMREEIENDAAWTFSRAFYRALANGRSVANALEQSKAALAFRGMSEEELPALVAHGLDASNLGLDGVGPSAAPITKLSDDDIETIVNAAIECDLTGRRGELLARLPNALRANLSESRIPASQLRQDLITLNKLGKVKGTDEPVIALWLKSAEYVAGYRYESEVFTRMREQVLGT